MHEYIKNNTKYVLGIRERVVYLIRCGKTNFYKIGRSTDLQRRLLDISASNPHLIFLEHVIVDPQYGIIEKRLHSMFQRKRLKGEWFCLKEKDVVRIMNFKSLKDLNEVYRNHFLNMKFA